MVNKGFWCVGLTGGIASGKSTVAGFFAARGIPVIDTDVVNAALIGPGGRALPALKAAFPQEFFSESAGLDRARMRQAAFQTPSIRQALEKILHPLIREEVDKALAEAEGPYVLVVIPLLFETGFYADRLDRILVVDVDETRQRGRALTRPGLTGAQLEGILSIQCPRDERLRRADDVIENNGDLEALEAAVQRLHERYLGLAKG